jgi:hypothetical protein
MFHLRMGAYKAQWRREFGGRQVESPETILEPQRGADELRRELQGQKDEA